MENYGVCGACGDPGHRKWQCPRAHLACHICNKVGHTAVMCRQNVNGGIKGGGKGGYQKGMLKHKPHCNPHNPTP